MPTPITPERLAELTAMPHDPRNSYAVINREDFDGLLALVDAVLNPPPEVAEAITRVETNGYRSTPHSNELQMLADLLTLSGFLRSLITPAAKETT